MRSTNTIEEDLRRLNLQMTATMNSRTMSGEDIRITLEGFAIQKKKLDQELSDAQRIENIEVQEAIVVSQRPEEQQVDSEEL